MTAETLPPAAPPQDAWRGRPVVLGRVLVATWLVLVACTVVLGHRHSAPEHLGRVLADGAVTTVHVDGGLGPDETGWSTVRLRWRSGVIGREVEMAEASSAQAARQATGRVPAAAVVVGDLETLLADRYPGVDFVETEPEAAWSEGYGWTTPVWVAVAYLGVLFATLVLVRRGPTPWRATRWAWAWIALLSPYGVLAFLLLGGATGLLRPRDPARVRIGTLSGFLVALLLAAATW